MLRERPKAALENHGREEDTEPSAAAGARRELPPHKIPLLKSSSSDFAAECPEKGMEHPERLREREAQVGPCGSAQIPERRGHRGIRLCSQGEIA